MAQTLSDAAAETSNPPTPHQHDTWMWLDANLAPCQSDEFWRRYDAKPKPEPEPPATDIDDHAIKYATALCKEWEGCHLKAYPDPATGGDPWTIGWGTTVYPDGAKVRAGDTCTKADAERWLAMRLECDHDTLCDKVPNYDTLPAHRRGALLSFSYNLGVNWYGSSGFATITRNMREADWAAIPGTLMMYRNPGTNVEIGLGRRRYSEGLVWREWSVHDACEHARDEIVTRVDCERVEQELKAAGASEPPAEAAPPPPPNTDPSEPQQISGMVGPTKTPHDFDMRAGDCHIIVIETRNRPADEATCYDYDGKILWRRDVLARGTRGSGAFDVSYGDTPPGLWELIEPIYRDYENNPNPPRSSTLLSYGWYSITMKALESQDVRNGRSGIMSHGGGTALGWPGAWAPQQELVPTHGCIRFHNQDLRDLVVPLIDKARLFMSVYQEA